MVTEVQVLVRALEVPHGESTLPELESHETVQVFVNLVPAELMMPDPSLLQDVHDLADLHMEISPHLRVILDKRALDSLLCDNDISLDLCVRTAFEVSEIGLHHIRHVLSHLMVIGLLAEDILFLKRITLAQCLDDIVQHIRKHHVLLSIGTVLLHRVLDLNDDRAVTLLREKHRVQQVPVVILDVLQLSKQTVQRFFLS